MQQTTFLLYGGNGYTGELIARYAAQYGLQPVLSGRNKTAVETLAKQLSLPCHIVALDNEQELLNTLKRFTLVVNAAGPYDITARPMISACLQTGTHYIDLNGDIDIFEAIKQYHQQAVSKNIMLLPGAGFDVVPTDCLALLLKKRMPDAVSLTIAFVILNSTLSRGTAITTLQKLGLPGAVRHNGLIIPEPAGKRGLWVKFSQHPKPLFTMSIPWGDISTAYTSTQIPDIVTYTGIQRGVWWFLKAQRLFNWLLRKQWVHRLIEKRLKRQPAGPDDAMRNNATSLIQATVTNGHGETLTAQMQCPEAYELTAHSVLQITQKILNNQFKAGYQTPSGAYGEDLVTELPGVTIRFPA